MNLIRMILAAEMLKPVTPTVNSEDKTVTEYFPHLVIVHNKAEYSETDQSSQASMETFYSSALTKSRLQWRGKGDNSKPTVVMVPDYEGERADQLPRRMKPLNSFESAVEILRKSVFSLKRTPLTQTRLTEKTWVSLANRTWDSIKNSSFYMEYSRLLP